MVSVHEGNREQRVETSGDCCTSGLSSGARGRSFRTVGVGVARDERIAVVDGYARRDQPGGDAFRSPPQTSAWTPVGLHHRTLKPSRFDCLREVAGGLPRHDGGESTRELTQDKSHGPDAEKVVRRCRLQGTDRDCLDVSTLQLLGATSCQSRSHTPRRRSVSSPIR